MNVEIQPWSETYEEWLRGAIARFFEAGLARGGELLNTPRNVDLYYKIGLNGAKQGDACLLALVDNTPVAYVMWVGSSPLVDTLHRTVNAIGSYTEPAFRNRIIATILREKAIQISVERGYERATGPVQLNNARGIREFCVAYNAWPTSVNFDFDL